MSFLNKKIKLKIGKFIFIAQAALLWFYLFSNVASVGNAGVALPYLAIYFLLGILLVFLKNNLHIPKVTVNFAFFLLFFFWISFRYLVDKDGTYDFMQVTIGTTGGIFTFYLLGLFIKEGLESLQYNESSFFGLVLLYTAFVVWLIFDFSERKMPDLFLLFDINGFYQRPGDFLSIGYLLFSYIFALSFISKKVNSIGFIIYPFIFYTLNTVLLLMCSQLIGSNSATAVIIGVYSLSVVFSISTNKRLLIDLCGTENKGNKLVKYLISWMKNSFIFVGISLVFTTSLILCTDFDLSKLRVFGFGAGRNSSLESRNDILVRWGVEQISHAPIFGNIDVAYQVTGDAGIILHNFLPSIWANLGLYGLFIFFLILFFIYRQNFSTVLRVEKNHPSRVLIKKAASIYSSIILLFLFLFANISTSYSWIVFWFAAGFFSLSFSQPIDTEYGIINKTTRLTFKDVSY